jgi:hypothetical protein
MADYPISNVPRRIVYTGSAGVGPYAFGFEVLLNTDIKVYKNDVLLTLTTDYTVSISSTLGTGSVTLVSAATGSDRITIVGARPVERTTDFTTGGDFFANTVNDELDSQTILVQQVAETAERSIKAPVTDPTNINMTLPINTARAGKTLAFDASGNPVAGDPIGIWRGNWAAGVSYQNRDLVKDTTNDNVYIVLTAHTSTGSLPISTNADSAKWGLVVDAAAAGEARIAAEAAQAAAELAETNAETAETNAETAETNAETAATNAASSASAAATSASNASSSASSASSSASAASTSATNAASSASAASTSATNASNSASAASSSASAASTSASNAATSETNAASSASAASTSASNAATSATNASNSASSASTSATNAASAQTAAEAARDQTLTAFDNFDDRYLGTKTSDPSVDNDGNALLGGALYFNSTDGVMKVYTGSAWVAAYASLSGALLVANNLSDLASASVARTNLGVAIGTDVQAYDADISTVSASQAEMEAGTESALRSMSPLRVKQAITANAPQAFPAGTRMSFQQTAAPTGWTKDTTAAIDDAVLRLVTGSVSSGGSTAFSTFNGQTTVGATTLSTSQIPSHQHRAMSLYNGDYLYAPAVTTTGAAWVSFGGSASRNAHTGSEGGGGSHNHSITTAIKYYDFIVASKD